MEDARTSNVRSYLRSLRIGLFRARREVDARARDLELVRRRIERLEELALRAQLELEPRHYVQR